jgi:hypothetical protein
MEFIGLFTMFIEIPRNEVKVQKVTNRSAVEFSKLDNTLGRESQGIKISDNQPSRLSPADRLRRAFCAQFGVHDPNRAPLHHHYLGIPLRSITYPRLVVLGHILRHFSSIVDHFSRPFHLRVYRAR